MLCGRSLEPQLNFTFGAQVCRPGPAQWGSSSSPSMTIGDGGWPLPVWLCHLQRPGPLSWAFCPHIPLPNGPHEKRRFTGSLQVPTRTPHPTGWLSTPLRRGALEAQRLAPLSPTAMDGCSMVVLLVFRGQSCLQLSFLSGSPRRAMWDTPGHPGTSGQAHKTRVCMSPTPPVPL